VIEPDIEDVIARLYARVSVTAVDQVPAVIRGT
jgi:hypothetical protein